MFLRGVCFAYYVCIGSAVAATANERAREMAECGYLAHMAVQQMKERADRPPVYEDLISNVIDFTNLYYHLTDRDRPIETNGITGEMLFVTANAGKEIHDARTRAMNPKNALKLSNTVLKTCRSDLKLFAQKMKYK